MFLHSVSWHRWISYPLPVFTRLCNLFQFNSLRTKGTVTRTMEAAVHYCCRCNIQQKLQAWGCQGPKCRGCDEGNDHKYHWIHSERGREATCFRVIERCHSCNSCHQGASRTTVSLRQGRVDQILFSAFIWKKNYTVYPCAGTADYTPHCILLKTCEIYTEEKWRSEIAPQSILRCAILRQ